MASAAARTAATRPVALAVRHRHRERAGRGLAFAAAAFIDRAVAEAARTMRGRPVLLLTGGGGAGAQAAI